MGTIYLSIYLCCLSFLSSSLTGLGFSSPWVNLFLGCTVSKGIMLDSWFISSPKTGLGTLGPFWWPVLQIRNLCQYSKHPLWLTFSDSNFLYPWLPCSKELFVFKQMYYMILSQINWKKTKDNCYFEIYPYRPQHPHPEQLFFQGIACSVSVSLPVSCFLAGPDSLGPWRSLHCHSWHFSRTVTENSSWYQMVCSSIRRTSLCYTYFPSALKSGFTLMCWKECFGWTPQSLPPRFLPFCLYHKSQTNVHLNKITKKELSHV